MPALSKDHPLEPFLGIAKGPSNGNHQHILRITSGTIPQHSLRITSGTVPGHSLQHPPRRLKPVVENQVWCTDEKPPTFGAPHSEPTLNRKRKTKRITKNGVESITKHPCAPIHVSVDTHIQKVQLFFKSTLDFVENRCIVISVREDQILP